MDAYPRRMGEIEEMESSPQESVFTKLGKMESSYVGSIPQVLELIRRSC